MTNESTIFLAFCAPLHNLQKRTYLWGKGVLVCCVTCSHTKYGRKNVSKLRVQSNDAIVKLLQHSHKRMKDV